MPDAAYQHDGEAREAAMTLCEGHPDVLSYVRVFPSEPGAERYLIVFSSGMRVVAEFAPEERAA